ncbi:MAG: sulfite exporter TauE/SafE family protein [Actinobacteria bacterium]|nr:sulfite exporter TauE/SafE family protein [Actinomycetota bacterium]
MSRNNSSQNEIELATGKVPNRKDYLKIISISIFAGFVFGLIGAGGGFLYVPILIILFGLPIKVAIGTSLLIMLLNAIPGIIGKLLTVRFDIFIGLAVAIGAIGGARLGTYLHKKIKDKCFSFIFIVLLIIIIARVGLICIPA